MTDHPVRPLVIGTIWRYPVKSLGGEMLDAVTVGTHGLLGDRAWGLRDLETGRILTARRRPELLFASAAVVDGECMITLPDGTQTTDDTALSAWLGSDVALVAAVPDESGTYETPIDAEDEDAADWVSWNGPGGSFHDSNKARVSMVSTATLRDWDVRRFRPNLVLDGSGEDGLVGHTVRIGDVVIEMNKAIDRCVMVTRPQPGLDRDLDVLRVINRERDSVLAVGGNVAASGTISVGDPITVVDEP